MRKIVLFVFVCLVTWVARRQIARASAQVRGQAETQLQMMWMLMASVAATQPNPPVPANTANRVDGLINLLGAGSGTSSGVLTGGFTSIPTTTQGAVPQVDSDSIMGSAPGTSYSQSIETAIYNRVNNLIGDVNGLGAGSVQSLVDRINVIINYLDNGGGGMYDYINNSVRPRLNECLTALGNSNQI